MRLFEDPGCSLPNIIADPSSPIATPAALCDSDITQYEVVGLPRQIKDVDSTSVRLQRR
jgi:hypothetical protein